MRIGSGRESLVYSSAGHLPGLLLNGQGGVDRFLGSTSVPLGLFQNCDFPATELPLKPQQTLALVTDGITEAKHGDQDFGIPGVLEYIRAHRNERATEIAQGLCLAVRGYAGGDYQHDDLTSVVLKVEEKHDVVD
jgi:sigma-B regulation protein RsbU (phosphoserine phosphatase)